MINCPEKSCHITLHTESNSLSLFLPRFTFFSMSVEDLGVELSLLQVHDASCAYGGASFLATQLSSVKLF